ncbi:MAG: hypothetical protein K8W52_45015 [Deltaproteobacteria bacterium]|nr:hypothetical protein [Deltaproteobacteria bacterium]
MTVRWAIAMTALCASSAAASPRPAIPPPPPSPPDPAAVEQASEANLDEPAGRSGFRLGAALGPATQLGFGIDESSGVGFGVSLRIGTSASPRLAWMVELAFTGYRAENNLGQATTNTSSLTVLGAQLHVRDSFWLRGGAGFATFSRRTETGPANRVFAGVGAVGGAGFDVLRRGSFAVSLEACATAAFYGSGTVLGGFGALGVMFY